MNQTLENVLTDLTMQGGDRAAIVRPAQMGKSAAICVLMTNKQALRALGKPLLRVATTLGTAPADFGSPGMSEKIGLGPLFEIVDAAPNGWCWGAFKFFTLDVTLALFSRSLNSIAEVCTEHGAPCSLDPQQPAEGYEIEKILHRSQ